MIDPKELRRGNLVHHGYRVQTINEIHEESAEVENGNLFYTSLFPIPLTEEWLLKFGFEKSGMQWTVAVKSEKTDMIALALYQIVDGEFMVGIGNFIIQFVHQLQNLYYALTGEELTYESDTASQASNHNS